MIEKLMSPKTPEEAMDVKLISGGYEIFILIVMFLMGIVTLFVGLFSTNAAAMAGGAFAYILAPVVLGTTIWDIDPEYRMIRLIHKQSFFPIRTRQFIISKLKLITVYCGSFLILSVVLQLLCMPLFGQNLIAFSGTFFVSVLVNMVIYTLISTVRFPGHM